MECDYFSSPQKGTIGILLEVHVSILLKLQTDLYLTIHTFIKYKKKLKRKQIDKCQTKPFSYYFQFIIIISYQLMVHPFRFFNKIHTHLDTYIKTTELHFNSFTANIDFTAFCVIYAIILIWILRRLNRNPIFKPQNKELVSFKQKTKKAITTFIVSLPIIKQITMKKFSQGMKKLEKELSQDLEKNRDAAKSRKLPTQGMKKENIESRIQKWTKSEEQHMFTQKLSGMIYIQTGQFYKEVSDFASKYLYQNPLHIDYYKELGKMECEVLRMTNSLFSKNKAYGIVTSGGSQSLILSLYAYKKYYKKDRPNIVVPHTIHAAVDKGAMYFNIQVRKARVNQKFQADVKHMQSLIDSNTIALYASYPNYPHGIVDPVEDIASLALKYKVGFHLDGCLGGFVAAFLKQHQKKYSFDLDGITSISIDHHKYGLAPKGISNLFFKTRQLRHKAFFIYTDWIGGIYATPSIVGSRSGFASAGAWYVMTHVGLKQYKDNALAVSQAVKTAASQLSKINGVEIFGKPELCVIAFNVKVVDVYSLASILEKEKHWHLSAIHLPKGVHICVTPANCQNVRKNLAKDVKECMQRMIKQGNTKQTSTAAVYGASASLPSAEMGDQMMKTIMQTIFK